MTTETTVTVRTESIERGAFVREFRRLHRVELAELASRSDLSVSMLSQFERGHRNLSGEAWKRVLTAINEITNENAEALGVQFKNLHSEWLDLFFPTPCTRPEEIFADALSRGARLSIVEKQQKEVCAALEIWETVQKLVPEADAEIRAENDAALLADPAECLRQLKQVTIYCTELRAAIEASNTKLANLEKSDYAIMPKSIETERNALRDENAKLLADLHVLRGEG